MRTLVVVCFEDDCNEVFQLLASLSEYVVNKQKNLCFVRAAVLMRIILHPAHNTTHHQVPSEFSFPRSYL
jgi:hypothetical protein